MKWFVVLVFLLLLNMPAQAAPGAAEAQVLKEIEYLLGAPLSQRGKKAAERIAQLGDKGAYQLVLPTNRLPWLRFDRIYPHTDLLIAAFYSGQLEARFINQESADPMYAGTLTVLHLYESIKELKRDYRIRELEKLATLHRANRLREYLAQPEVYASFFVPRR